MSESNDPSVSSVDSVKAVKARSPNYPSLSLAKAIEKAGVLHGRYKRHPVPVNAAFQAMEYKAGSSTGQQAIAALRAFGLMDVQGSGENRKVQVSDRAQKILLNHPSRPTLLREAALNPKIHKEIW